MTYRLLRFACNRVDHPHIVVAVNLGSRDELTGKAVIPELWVKCKISCDSMHRVQLPDGEACVGLADPSTSSGLVHHRRVIIAAVWEGTVSAWDAAWAGGLLEVAGMEWEGLRFARKFLPRLDGYLVFGSHECRLVRYALEEGSGLPNPTQRARTLKGNKSSPFPLRSEATLHDR